MALMEDVASPACKVCGQRAVFFGTTLNPQSPTVHLRHCRCSGCGLVFIGNTITPQELAIAYASYDSAQYYAEIAQENAKKFDRSIADLVGHVPRDAPILDLGTGNGAFLEKLLAAGFTRVSGQEIPGADLARVEALGCRVYRGFDYSDIPAARFEVVTLLDMAEHVIDPHVLFGACARMLRPGGRVYVHTPVVTRMDRLMQALQRYRLTAGIGSTWQRGRTNIFHLQNYTPEALRIVLARAGFTDVRIRVENELSWPVSSYVKVFLCQRFGLPGWTAPLLAPLFHPLLKSGYFNANKAIVTATRS